MFTIVSNRNPSRIRESGFGNRDSGFRDQGAGVRALTLDEPTLDSRLPKPEARGLEPEARRDLSAKRQMKKIALVVFAVCLTMGVQASLQQPRRSSGPPDKTPLCQFTARVMSIEMVGNHPAQVVPVGGADLHWLVRIEIVSIEKPAKPFEKGQASLLIHSPALFFSGRTAEEPIGKEYSFDLFGGVQTGVPEYVFGYARPKVASGPGPAELSRQFVQDFYDWYIKVGYSEEVVFRDRAQLFDPPLLAAMKSVRAVNVSSIDCAFDGDLFTFEQESSKAYRAGAPSLNGNTFRVPLYRMQQGTTTWDLLLYAEVRRIDGRWRFVNLHYTENHRPGNLLDDLRGILTYRVQHPECVQTKSKK